MRKKTLFEKMPRNWEKRVGILILGIFVLLSRARISPPPGTGEKPIPPGIENHIHPHITTQDDVLALLGEPVARLKTQTKTGHVHTWTYSYMDLQSAGGTKGESLTITFDDKSFAVLSVIRGPL